MLFRWIYNRKFFKLLNAKKYWVAPWESLIFQDCFPFYLNSGRRKTVKQPSFCCLFFFLTKLQPILPVLQRKVQKPSLKKHVNPTFPDSDTKILPDHHLRDLAELMGLHGQYILRENMIHISFKDQSPRYAISRRNEFLATQKQTPSLQSHWCKPSLAQRVEQ